MIRSASIQRKSLCSLQNAVKRFKSTSSKTTSIAPTSSTVSSNMTHLIKKLNSFRGEEKSNPSDLMDQKTESTSLGVLKNKKFFGIVNNRPDIETLTNLLAPGDVIQFKGNINVSKNQVRPLKLFANMKLNPDPESFTQETSQIATLITQDNQFGEKINNQVYLNDFSKNHYKDVSNNLNYLMNEMGAGSTGTKEQDFTAKLMDLTPLDVDKILMSSNKTPLSQWQLLSILSFFRFRNVLTIRRFTLILMKLDLQNTIHLQNKFKIGELKLSSSSSNSNNLLDFIDLQITFSSKFKFLNDNQRSYQIINDSLLNTWLPNSNHLPTRLLINMIRLIKDFYKSSLSNLQDIIIETENQNLCYIYWEELRTYKSSTKIIDYLESIVASSSQSSSSSSSFLNNMITVDITQDNTQSKEQLRKPQHNKNSSDSFKTHTILNQHQQLVIQFLKNPLIFNSSQLYNDLILISKKLKLNSKPNILPTSIEMNSRDEKITRKALADSLATLISKVDIHASLAPYSELSFEELENYKNDLQQHLDEYSSILEELDNLSSASATHTYHNNNNNNGQQFHNHHHHHSHDFSFS